MSVRLERTILVFLTLAILALCIGSVRDDTATSDEAAHIAAGLVRLRHGSFEFFYIQPPLMNAITALPLAARGCDVPPVWRTLDQWTVGHMFLYGTRFEPRDLLFLARLPTIILFLALCFVVYWFVKRETGSGLSGLMAFLITGLCPNLMAHGRLATVDLATTALIFTATVLYLRLLERPSIALGAAAGAAVGCAILVKISSLILFPWLALLLAIYLAGGRAWRPLLAPLSALALMVVVVMYATYFALAGGELLQHEYSGIKIVIMPLREYGRALSGLGRWYTHGYTNPQFLLGAFSYQGWPQYFLIAFLLKTPIATQVMFIFACVVAARRRHFGLRACVLFVFVFMAVAATSNIDVGIRYVLPIYPFVIAAIAISLAEAWRDAPERRKTLAVGVAVLIGWNVWANVAAYPSYLSYFNEMIGNHRNADRFLIDSNLDWGQDLHRLKIWCDRNNVGSIRVDYFGAGDLFYEFGPRALPWEGPSRQLLPPGWFAVSRHLYRISFIPRPGRIDYDTYLAASHARYVATAGGSIDIYRVR